MIWNEVVSVPTHNSCGATQRFESQRSEGTGIVSVTLRHKADRSRVPVVLQALLPFNIPYGGSSAQDELFT